MKKIKTIGTRGNFVFLASATKTLECRLVPHVGGDAAKVVMSVADAVIMHISPFRIDTVPLDLFQSALWQGERRTYDDGTLAQIDCGQDMGMKGCGKLRNCLAGQVC